MKRVRLAVFAGLIASISLMGVAIADHAAVNDSNQGHEATSVVCAPVDEGCYGSRDGWDHWHVSYPGTSSLAELEGYITQSHTFDANVAESARGAARGVRVSGVVRIQLRGILQRFESDVDTEHWVDVSSSTSVNTGANRTITVQTGLISEADEDATFVPGWYRMEVRSLNRYFTSTGPLVFYVKHTYPIWLGDGPVDGPVPV